MHTYYINNMLKGWEPNFRPSQTILNLDYPLSSSSCIIPFTGHVMACYVHIYIPLIKRTFALERHTQQYTYYSRIVMTYYFYFACFRLSCCFSSVSRQSILLDRSAIIIIIFDGHVCYYIYAGFMWNVIFVEPKIIIIQQCSSAKKSISKFVRVYERPSDNRKLLELGRVHINACMQTKASLRLSL